ncbi:MAG: hypothetical protein XD82_0556 [Methanoculleus marisnigri]|uniref:Uncharacterized protein n=1 Tax=Methanoculleus marisnigri TaxID=2198 RepID=A0A101GR30_9EURY|nr:MAG: hypothetical protein XD82_0556 [Methanoculleus marisnigri]
MTLIWYVYGVRLYHGYSILPLTRVRTRENAKLQRTATPDHLRDFGRHGAMPDRLPPPGRRSGGSSGRRLPGNRHPCRGVRSRRTPARVLPPFAGLIPVASSFCLLSDSAATYPVCRSGSMYPSRILFGFAPKTRDVFGSSQKPKPSGVRARPGLPGPGFFPPFRVRSGEALDKLPDLLRIPDTADRSAAAHLKTPLSGSSAALSGDNSSSSSRISCLSSSWPPVPGISGKVFGRDDSHPK